MYKYIKVARLSHKINEKAYILCYQNAYYQNKRLLSDKIISNFADKYSPGEVEKKSDILNTDLYKFDVNNDNFQKEIFSLVLPPPNITGSLHLGHALTATIQDVLCRWKRMNNCNVCWLPGIDHAGIATQVVVEKFVSKTNKHKLNYEQFQNELWNWKDVHERRIQEQLKMLGTTLDWSRKTFTMDSNQTESVKEAFIRLFEEGLIYRANKLVNWSCQLKSTISDIEVQNVDITGYTDLNIPGYSKSVRFGFLAEVAYKVDNSNEEIVIATTRPETILGDVAVAVHPADSRYSHIKGCKLKHPFINKTIPLIEDESVDINFGTGAVKITPAHDGKDFIISEKHNLDKISVINDKGLIEEGFTIFSGMKRYDARELIMSELKKLDLLRNIEEHNMVIPICSRSGDVIEQLFRPQWYIDCKQISQIALNCVKDGLIEIVPQNFEKIWYDWSENHQDWCISRQLWWGHKMPIYKCYINDNIDEYIWIAAYNDEDAKVKAENKLNSSNISCVQESDVLDTWFSSAIYPFSSHGWPNSNTNYKSLYPLDVMITGHDILRFWVHKMVMMGIKLTGQIPFSKIFLHGIVCDANGSKMSKSKGNVIDPYDVIEGISLNELKIKTEKMHKDGLISKEEYDKSIINQKQQFPNGIPQCGADALRFTLCSQDVKKMYINFILKDCNANRLFCNKIWQSIKYACGMVESLDSELLNQCEANDLNVIDLWLLSRLHYLTQSVIESFENLDFHHATEALHKFLYNEMCDVYIECTKQNYKQTLDKKKMAAHCHVFSVSFNTALRFLSPFMPFLTNKLIPNIPLNKNFIYNYEDTIHDLTVPKIADFQQWKNVNLDKEINSVLDIVSCVRKLKVLHNINKQSKPVLYLNSEDGNTIKSLMHHENLLLYLSHCDKIIVDNQKSTNIQSFNSNGSIKINLEVDEDQLKMCQKVNFELLLKKRKNIVKRIDKYNKIMTPEGFKTKVPKEVQLDYINKMNASKEELNKIDKILKDNKLDFNEKLQSESINV